MEQSIISQINSYRLLNSGYKIIARREDDIEMDDDDEIETDDHDGDNNTNKSDTHEGSERMPDIDDIFKRDDGFSFAEAF